MVVTPPIGVYDDPKLTESRSDRMLGLVDFTLLPHLDHPDMPDASLAYIERWAAGIPVPAYAIDDQTAIVVRDGTVEVVSEGHWKRFVPKPCAHSHIGFPGFAGRRRMRALLTRTCRLICQVISIDFSQHLRYGAVCPGTVLQVLILVGKCLRRRAKPAHIRGHLPGGKLAFFSLYVNIETSPLDTGPEPGVH
jgi:hypothetical protein